MINEINLFALFTAYLLGSIPSAVWIGRKVYNIDVREFGSGNAGASNTFRVLGFKAGISVLIIDTLKGSASVFLSFLIMDGNLSSESLINLQLSFGIAALLGHIFPVFAGFRGGKGIATLLGIVLAVHPQAALISILVFLVILLISHYVSLSSIFASFAFPFSIMIVYKETVSSLILFSLFITVIVLITHQRNIERLLRRQEAKANLTKKMNGRVLKSFRI